MKRKYPKTLFDNMILVNHEKCLSAVELKNSGKSSEYVYFHAREDSVSIVTHQFQAFDTMKDKINKMKLKEGSKVDIIAETKKYVSNGKFDYIFNILSIEFSEHQESEKNEIKPRKEKTESNNNTELKNIKETFDIFEGAELPEGYKL